MLSILIFFPCVIALILFLVPKSVLKSSALVLSVVEFIFSLTLLRRMDFTTADLQLVEKHSWIESLGINYFVGVDGISLWLVILTTFLLPITILGCWNGIKNNLRIFYAMVFALQTSMLGSFLAFDGILFYVFFEASLIPMFFMIGLWGGENKIYASLKLFIFTMAGSLLMLVGIISLMLMTRAMGDGQMSASILDFYKLDIFFVADKFFSTQTLLFFAFSIAFCIKVPLFPLHTWLPDAHVQAPTPGSVLLAGVMLKMGTYGLLRFVLPIFPDAVEYWGWVFMTLSVVGIIYGALVAMVQPDMKKLVAYSSISHMGYVVLGLFAMNEAGVTGALYQMINHGISTGALFLLVGMVYEKTHSRKISEYGGLASVAPWYTIAFVIITLSSIAVPLTNGFIGEFLILLGGFQKSAWHGGFAAVGVILGAVYMLWLVKRVFYGPEGDLVKKHGSALEIITREKIVLCPLIALVFFMGVYPNIFLEKTKNSVQHLVKQPKAYLLQVLGSDE